MRILDHNTVIEQLNLFPYPIRWDKCRKCDGIFEEIAWRNDEAVAWKCPGDHCYILRMPTEWETPVFRPYAGMRPSYL